MAQAVIVPAISELIQGAPGTVIPFQFDDHGWILMPDWYKYHVRKSFSFRFVDYHDIFLIKVSAYHIYADTCLDQTGKITLPCPPV